jgi:hypothetical protein
MSASTPGGEIVQCLVDCGETRTERTRLARLQHLVRNDACNARVFG